MRVEIIYVSYFNSLQEKINEFLENNEEKIIVKDIKVMDIDKLFCGIIIYEFKKRDKYKRS